jgi:hypothetical protein
VNCAECQKKLRSDNTIGYCYNHRSKSEKVLSRIKKWQKANPEKRSIARKKYYDANFEELAAKSRIKSPSKQKRIKNYNESYKPRRNSLNAQRRLVDIVYKLKGNLRSRLRQALKRNSKKGSAVKDLGCTIQELKEYIEVHFEPGMTWDNYGKWHLDHIKPLSMFDLQDETQFKEAVNYMNLQPMWAEENISKGGSNRKYSQE